MSDAPRKQRRWLVPLLFASLAINLLIVGIVAGWLVSPSGPSRSGELGPVRGLVGEPFLRALNPAQRKELIREARREAKGLQETREGLRSKFEAFLSAVRAEPYDPAIVTQLLAQQRDAAMQRLDLGERLLLKRLEAMSSSERSTYADALEKSMQRFRRQPKD